ncbi:hypothetical protein [uncultured Massilia sp.]|uniref:hypothetical protein n=1 Tax=uncultured Massilia sp. TaxID=169973 RepID=UPI0025F417B8|nr:hypothetical protein [uncultured Massilia sp.]
MKTVHATTQVDGLDVFDREAGPQDGPAGLLLHGFPSSSRLYAPRSSGCTAATG